jgi:hypothetical protein
MLGVAIQAIERAAQNVDSLNADLTEKAFGSDGLRVLETLLSMNCPDPQKNVVPEYWQ